MPQSTMLEIWSLDSNTGSAVAKKAECFGLSTATAERVLRTWALRANTSLAHIADVLVRQIWHGDEIPQDRALARTIERYLRDLPNVLAPSDDTTVAPANAPFPQVDRLGTS